MTSATGERTARCEGYSLFEVLIVLAIIAMFTGFFLVRFDDGAAEEGLTQAATDIKAAALKAKKRAYAFRRDQYILFSRGGFVLTESPPLAEGAAAIEPRPEARGGSFNESYRVPSEATMELLPPGSKRWTKEPGIVWTFRSSGLSDPMAVRFTVGKSYARLQFNVLTGLAEEEIFIE
jgi:prepilin-type N-terminal cleavage/methylation domain-containing protein